MKKKLYSIIILTTLTLLTLNIFIKSNTLNQTIVFSINLFIKNILPSLFPMFIISFILVELDIPLILGNLLKKPIHFLFKSKKEASFIFFMSMITGFPSSAKYLDDLMNKNILTNKDSEKILMFTFFSNPLFIVNTVGTLFLGNKQIGICLLISHIIGNIIVGIIFRKYNKEITQETTKIKNLSYLNNKINNTNIFTVLIKAIENSLKTLINIFGIITFFLIITNLTYKDTTNLVNIIQIGLLEMTSGLKYLSLSNIDINIKLPLAAFFISFGGFSIHFQIMSILNKKKVKYLPFLIARIIHGIISFMFMMVILQKMDILS